jgi:hypothetical protein
MSAGEISNRTDHPLDGPLSQELRELIQGAPNNQTGTTYTVVSGDFGRRITLNNSSPITVTIPSGLPTNFFCFFIQTGTGQVTFAASGVTLNSYSSQLKMLGQHCRAYIDWTASETYNLAGDLTA